MKKQMNRTGQDRTERKVKRSTKGKGKEQKTVRPAKKPTLKQLYSRYFPVLPVSPFVQNFEKAEKPFSAFHCFSKKGNNSSCNNCKASGFCKDATDGKNLFNFPIVSGMKEKGKRIVTQSTDNFKSFCVRTLLQNPGKKVPELLKRVHAKNPEKSLSSIKSKMSSYNCCLKAFSGKSKAGSAVSALAIVMTDGRTKGKAGIINKAAKLCEKPAGTVQANYSYMITVYTVMQELKDK